MSLPVAAVGALLAALLETSVLPELTLFGIKPDLVFALTVVVAMVIAFEDALAWAVVGGVLLDAMSALPIGATTLALLVVTGMATLAGRMTGAPRLITVGVVVFLLAWVYQVLLMAILAVAAGIGLVEIDAQRLFFIAVLDLLVAAVAVAVFGALLRRFGPEERADW